MEVNDRSGIRKLTALWALAESGLGGVMFALKIPLTGFIIGAIAIILISLIAKLSDNSWKEIISATIIVIIVKAIVSPHSPPPAYFAVLFQGFAGAVLFAAIPIHQVACMLLGIISMAESALQKILVLTLIFGKMIWQAVDSLVQEVAKIFHTKPSPQTYWWLIAGWVVLYMLWGLVVGWYAGRLPVIIGRQKNKVLHQYTLLDQVEVDPVLTQKKKNKLLLIYGLILLAIVAIFVISGMSTQKIMWTVARSIGAVIILFYLVQPLVKWLLNKWITSRKTESRQAGEIILLLPAIRRQVEVAYQMTSEKNYLQKIKSFVMNLIIITLYAK